ncbi:MAG: hypothetical protein H7329_03040 [Opitutaceae bacterium]|nr:hypothetical protein [Cytophagales bacterium]
MKKILFLLMVASQALLAQIPQAFNYQGIARDLSGNPLPNKSIKVRLSILSETGGTQTSLYSETHSLVTNQFGLFVLPVGKGTVVSGTFAGIAWTDASKKLLKSEIDPDGNGYSLNVTSDLQSVPFALSAKTVETENQKLTLAGSLLSISQGNSVDLSTFASGLWSKNANGINYNNGNVGIGTDNPNALLWIEKKATGADRQMVVINNTSDANDSFGMLAISSGTGSNQNSIKISAAAKSYFPNLLNSNMGAVASERLSLQSVPLAAGATGYINFVTGSNNTTDPNGGLERMRIEHNGNVGIGTTTPSQKLDVNGKLRIQDLSLNDAAMKILVSDATGVIGYKDASSFTGLSQWTNDSYGVNYSSGKVSIGESTGDAQLQIMKEATGTDRVFLRLHNTSNLQDGLTAFHMFSGTGTNLNAFDIGISSKSYFPNLPMAGYAIMRSERIGLSTMGYDLDSDAHIAFFTGANYAIDPNASVERMRIDKDGNIGMGTSTPKTQLHIKGAVYLEDATQGIIMRSPNGQCWKVTVGDTGTLTSTSVTCP